MSDSSTVRVLAALERVERRLHELETAIVDVVQANPHRYDGLSELERIDLMLREQHQLGEIGGLVTAQIELRSYRRSLAAGPLRRRAAGG